MFSENFGSTVRTPLYGVEVPIVVIVLVKIGLVDVIKLREWRPYVIVGAFVIGAIFTPPDVISMTLMALPMYGLYEVSIWLVVFIRKARDREDAAAAAAE